MNLRNAATGWGKFVPGGDLKSHFARSLQPVVLGCQICDALIAAMAFTYS